MEWNSWKLTATAISLFFCSLLAAQNTEKNSRVVVFLKDGSKITGEVVHWQPMDTLTIKMSWGQEIVLPYYRIRKFVQTAAKKELSAIWNYNAIEQGLYHQVQLGLIGMNSDESQNAGNGWQMTASTGWQFYHWLGLGAGVGYHEYEQGSGERVIPLFAEIRGAFFKHNCSPYYVLQWGYARGLASEKNNISEARGGRYISPALGMRFGRREVKYGVELGYQLQKARFEYDHFWPGSFFQEKSYRRISLRFSTFF